jgi:hypothetical protein
MLQWQILNRFSKQKMLKPLEEYIGCTIQNMPDKSKKIIQPDMIKKREKTFGDTVINHRCAPTPMGTGITVERPEENDQTLSKEQKGVYLVKYSTLDLSNADRALSKVMDGATEEHRRLIYRVLTFVLGTKVRGTHGQT